MTAFVLGAGLGTRLRPLTNTYPKPLLHLSPEKRLVESAFDHLIDQGGVTQFIINTHWCAERWEEAYPKKTYRNTPLHFVYEPTLLNTGGGLANIWETWQTLAPKEESLWLYNGDIFCDAPIEPLLNAHQNNQDICTLFLRSNKGNVAFDDKNQKIVDLRNHFQQSSFPQLTYGGIALLRKEFATYLQPAGSIFDLVDSWLKLIAQENKLAGTVIDQGHWADLGTLQQWQAASSQAQ